MTYPSSTRQKNYWLWGVATITLLLGVFIGVLMGRHSSTTPLDSQANLETTADNEAVMAVEAITPTFATSSQSIAANGSIVGKEIAHVGARVNGVAIEQVLVQIGDYVKAGQVLAILDDQAVKQDVVAAAAEVDQAQVNLAKAQADLARVEPLIKIDAISREQYDSYQVAVLQARSQKQAAEARLSNVRTHQGNTQVVAPVSGIISERTADVGMMTTGATLFSIIKNGVLEWQAGVNAYDARLISVGLPVQIDTPNGVATGVVTRIAPVTSASRELIVHATINQGDLSSGMYQSGKILLGSQNVLTLPRQAIMSSDGYDYVWRLVKQGNDYQVQRSNVVLGASVGESVVVDLPADTWVVAQGGGFLNEGDKVTVSNFATVNTNSQPSASSSASLSLTNSDSAGE